MKLWVLTQCPCITLSVFPWLALISPNHLQKALIWGEPKGGGCSPGSKKTHACNAQLLGDTRGNIGGSSDFYAKVPSVCSETQLYTCNLMFGQGEIERANLHNQSLENAVLQTLCAFLARPKKTVSRILGLQVLMK